MGGTGGTRSTRYLASIASAAAIFPSSAIPPPVNWLPRPPGMSMLRPPMFSAGTWTGDPYSMKSSIAARRPGGVASSSLS